MVTNGSYPLVVFFVTIALFFVFSSPVYADKNDQPNISVINKDGLELIISTDKKFYREGEVMRISWNLTNISSEDAYYLSGPPPCNSGHSLQVFNSDFNDVNSLLSPAALLIKKDDPILSKFNSDDFYGEILEMIKIEPTKEVVLLIITPDADKLRKLLREEYDLTQLGKGGFVGAKVMAKDIPQIAKSNYVRQIWKGDQPICFDQEIIYTLKPNQTIGGQKEWSQLVQLRDGSSSPQRVPEGFYSIDIRYVINPTNEFGNDISIVSNCVTVGLVGEQPLELKQKIPCGLLRIPSGLNKTQIIGVYEQWLSMYPFLNETLLPILNLLYSQENMTVKSSVQSSENQIKETIKVDKNNVSKIQCKKELVLLSRSTGDASACVSVATAQKLVKRGWKYEN